MRIKDVFEQQVNVPVMAAGRKRRAPVRALPENGGTAGMFMLADWETGKPGYFHGNRPCRLATDPTLEN